MSGMNFNVKRWCQTVRKLAAMSKHPAASVVLVTPITVARTVSHSHLNQVFNVAFVVHV